MPTIAEQLTQLASDRDDLVSNLTTKGITGLTGDETFTELVPEVLNIPSGGDTSEYYTNIQSGTSSRPGVTYAIKKIPADIGIIGNSLAYAFYNCVHLESIPSLNTTNITNMQSMCSSCSGIRTVELFDASNVTNLKYAFSNCVYINTFPQLNLSKANNIEGMLYNVGQLTSESLNNVLGMCASATSYAGTKTLEYIFGPLSSSYPASTIQGLSNYQTFIDAGWTIGW